jgi:prepilin-type N-terminal cleavage/methylation domain-containing protein
MTAHRPATAPTRRRSAGGFTLVEIMIVVAIMGLVLAMGIPAMFRMSEKDSLRQVVKDIQDACLAARAQAILTGQTQTMTVRPLDRTIEVPGREPVKFSDRFRVEKLGVNFVEMQEADAAPVRFFANGTSDEFTILLISDHNEQRIITLDLVTALPDVDTDESKYRRNY